MLDWTHSQKQICRLRIKYKTLAWKLYPPIALGAAALVLRSGVMSPPKLSSGRGIGKVTPILYILKCHPLKSDVPSTRWLLIFFSCLVLDVLFLFFSYTISSSQFHNISHNSRPFFISHNFGLGLFSFFGGSLLIQLRPLSLPVHSTAVETDSINLWPKPVVVWLLRGGVIPWHENWWMSLQLERKVAAFPPPSEQSKKYIQNFLVDIHSLNTGKKITELVYNNI